MRGGRGRRAKKKACLVTGRVLEPDQSKTPPRASPRKPLLGRWLHHQSKGKPLVQNQNQKKDTGQMASTLQEAQQKSGARCYRTRSLVIPQTRNSIDRLTSVERRIPAPADFPGSLPLSFACQCYSSAASLLLLLGSL